MRFPIQSISNCLERARVRHKRTSTRSRLKNQLRFERLEERTLLAANVFNDPDYATIQWGLNNTGQNGGTYDVDIDAPAAWSITTGSTKTVLAEIDDGVDYTHADVYLNIWLNQDEIPAALRMSLTDPDADGRITFRDLNHLANAGLVSDLNGTGYVDAGDLLRDLRWADGIDDGGNGRIDDLVGWDFLDNDNDPMPAPGDGHGTNMAQWMGAIPSNGLGKVGVNWYLSMMLVRIRTGDVQNVDFSVQAAGLDYAVANGAPIAAIWGGNTTYPQVMFDAVERAGMAGVLVVVPAGNDSSDLEVAHRYPPCLSNDNLISVTAFNAKDGMDSVWNWGATCVDLAGPTAPGGATSGAAAHVAGVAALLKTIHPDWQYQQLKERILTTVEPSAALAGRTVTGGRLNAAMALATTSISISDPSILEGNTGTGQLLFTVTRSGDNSGELTLSWSTADGTAHAGSDYVAVSGQITFLASGPNAQTISVPVTGDLATEASENFFVRLNVISGNAVLADEDAQGLIVDNDTKFYVVNDAASDHTFEYASSGFYIESYALSNTAPRGAASTALGDKVWVVDANKKVYVYNTSGGLLGSWTASDVKQPEGITTNGSDVWILDAQSGKVLKYAGAATRTSGTMKSNGGFSLGAAANDSPKDLVTDGNSIWVVRAGKYAGSLGWVYKYSLAGQQTSYWTIDRDNASPTGITLDPANPAHLWIVDNKTMKVYQYSNAVDQPIGHRDADAIFALDPRNTNPQGIADPPHLGAEPLVAGDTPTSSTTAPPTSNPALTQRPATSPPRSTSDAVIRSREESGRLPTHPPRTAPVVGVPASLSTRAPQPTTARTVSRLADTALEDVLAEWDSDHSLALLLSFP